MAALIAAKPVTEESALAIALETMTGLGAQKELGQFKEWFKVNGKWLVERVNGGAE